MPNVYLVGMMGSGKSVTGKELAALAGAGFVDVDELIQERTRRTITEIFEKEGEAFFRKEEAEALKEASAAGPRVIATGGGTVLIPGNVERMRKTGKIVYLQTSLEVLWQRVCVKHDRPLLKSANPKENLSRIFAERKAIYETVCDFSVPTDGRTARSVALKIFERLEKRP